MLEINDHDKVFNPWAIPPDQIVQCCQSAFLGLPGSYQPSKRSNGVPQYCILAGIVLVLACRPETLPAMQCVTVATGSKCLPESRLPPAGDVLHDSHAEVLARRGLVRWIHEEIGRVKSSGRDSTWLETDSPGSFRLRHGVKVYMYVSTLPCGDASTLSLSLTQDSTMAALKVHSTPQATLSGSPARGRENYAALGVVRTKPGRADAPPTASMSCSDKIAMWSLVGMQGALLMCVLSEPVYLDGIVIGEVAPEFQEDARVECERAFWRRVESGSDHLRPPFRFHTPSVRFTSISMPHSRSQVPPSPLGELPISASESISWIFSGAGTFRQQTEALVNGIKRGSGKNAPSATSRSRLSKAALFALHKETMLPDASNAPPPTYFWAKQRSGQYIMAKGSLRGERGPLSPWKVSGERWESFL